MRRALVAVALAAGACVSTTDSVGHNGPGGITLKPLKGPASYPNPAKDILGKSDAEIATRIADTFDQLFHGDPSNEAIFFPNGDQASIRDLLHNDIRTEGIGWGMMIAVQLDKRTEFDQMWRYATSQLEFASGASQGYFRSSCDTESGNAPCTDPFGMEQFVTALLFAHDRWGSTTTLGYGKDALELLDVLRHKQLANGGIIDGVTDVFDDTSALAFDLPDETAAGRTRPSIAMPAYYELWAQATGDTFWTRAAASARQLWKDSADSNTGLMPVRATFEGLAVAGGNTFQPEAYRAQVNLVLDDIWFGRDAWMVEEADRLLAFFTKQGFDTYGTSWDIKGGTPLNPAREVALILINGMTAIVSTRNDRADYMTEAWETDTPSGLVRYYQGLLDLMALLLLSGNYRVW